MSISGFGVPSAGSHDSGDNADDEFQGFGVPGADSGEGSAVDNPLGVFGARCTGPKAVTSKSTGKRYLVLEFELMNSGEYDGEVYSLMAEAFDSDDDRKAKKKKLRNWQRIADACKAMGLAVEPRTLEPLDGWAATEGQSCRLAVSTYDKAGADAPTIVWGKPKSRKRNGVEVGFPADLANDRGKFRDYGCGVLPPD